MTEQLYVQCTLQSGTTHDVAWVPEDMAKRYNHVSFGDEQVWVVTTVGTVKLPWSQVNERSRDWKRTRAASDI